MQDCHSFVLLSNFSPSTSGYSRSRKHPNSKAIQNHIDQFCIQKKDPRMHSEASSYSSPSTLKISEFHFQSTKDSRSISLFQLRWKISPRATRVGLDTHRVISSKGMGRGLNQSSGIQACYLRLQVYIVTLIFTPHYL